MENQWFYKRDGQRQGPINDSELRMLAEDGGLSTEDLVWKEGLEEWRKASSLKGLFPKSHQSTPPPIPLIAGQENASALADATPSQQSSVSFGQSAKLAGDLAAKQSEITKINRLTLPAHYARIGSHAYELGIEKTQHRKLFEEIDHLNYTIREFEKAIEEAPQTTTFMDKAKSLAGKTVMTTKSKNAQFRRRRKLLALGKAVFESGNTPDACNADKTAVAKLLSRKNQLDYEIAALKEQLSEQGRRATKAGRSLFTSTAIVIAAATCCAPIGLFLIWRHPTWSNRMKVVSGGVTFLWMSSLLLAVPSADRAKLASPDTSAVEIIEKRPGNGNANVDLMAMDKPTSEPTLKRGRQQSSEELTASFYPTKAGLVWHYDRKLLTEKGSIDLSWSSTIEAVSETVLTIETRSLDKWNADRPSDKLVMWVWRSNDSVQCATVFNGKVNDWEPLVMIGARPGDYWETSNGLRFRLESIKNQDGVRVANIIKEHESDLFGDRIRTREVIVLREGVGLVSRKTFGSFNEEAEFLSSTIDLRIFDDKKNDFWIPKVE